LIFATVFVATVVIGQGYNSGWFTHDNLTQVADRPLSLIGKVVGNETSSAPDSQGARVDFSFCHNGGGQNCVVDGDTIWLRGEKIRIADIDTPETHEPQCASERQLGDRATQRLHEILEGGPITLETIDRDSDQYGRLLRIVKVDGRSVGNTLVDEGLARWYGNGRQPWC
jgi:endonuclease YncB( thermonuclease family)